ncbi:UNKNOWN [Stylonychia lemnae]|uniref:Uncharacterized protein n=1 Tax=Stylonychia lemnae TaxID=5949 RepID=A0A078AUU5_STYLE|nr:UNKNOWN [Stylonychia lemnae]|eukprot:CDW86165.1 UNKNOWN [Stylonychia lemnae]
MPNKTERSHNYNNQVQFDVNIQPDNDQMNEYDEEEVYIMTVEDDILENKFSEDARSPKLERLLNQKINNNRLSKNSKQLDIDQNDIEDESKSLKSVDTLNHELNITNDNRLAFKIKGLISIENQETFFNNNQEDLFEKEIEGINLRHLNNNSQMSIQDQNSQLDTTPTNIPTIKKLKIPSQYDKTSTNSRYRSMINKYQQLRVNQNKTKPNTHKSSIISVSQQKRQKNTTTTTTIVQHLNNHHGAADLKSSLKSNLPTDVTERYNHQMWQNKSPNIVNRLSPIMNRSITPENIEKEVRRLRQQVYYKEYVRPLQIRQQQLHQKKIKQYQILQSKTSQDRVRKSSQESIDKQTVDLSKILDISQHKELGEKVKKMSISDYYQNKRLNLRSNHKKVNVSMDSQTLKLNTSEFMTQIKDLSHAMLENGPEDIIPMILQTDQNKLKQELIDQEKAINIMKGLKEVEEDEGGSVDNKNSQENFTSSILFKDQMKSDKKLENHIKQQQWKSFIEYIKEKPDKFLRMVPSNHKTLEIPERGSNATLLKRPASRFQTLGSQYLAGIEMNRPSSCNQDALMSQSGINLLRPESRQINTAGYGMRPRMNQNSDLANAIVNFRQSRGVKSHYQSTGRVVMSSNFSKNRYNKLSKSRPSHMSTQYTNYLQGDDNKNMGRVKTNDNNNLSSIFSNQDSGMINNRQQLNQSQNHTNNQSFRQDQSNENIPIIVSNEFQNRPKTSASAQPRALLLLKKKNDKDGSLLSSVKFPEKNSKTPLMKISGPTKVADLSQMDTSILSIQERTKQKISIYERANRKMDEDQKRLLRKKWKGYSLANDLAGKFKVEEYKQNPNFNKFQRQVNQNGPLRQANLIDWKNSKIRAFIEKNQLDFNFEEDEKFFKTADIEYMINLFRYNGKFFSNIDQLKPVFNKALATLEKIMDELMIGYIFDRISLKITEISPENAMKILLRCRLMLQYRSHIINILQIIDLREVKLKDLNYIVIKGDERHGQPNDNNKSHSSIRTINTKGSGDRKPSQSRVGHGSANQKKQQENKQASAIDQMLSFEKKLEQKQEREELIKEKLKDLNDLTTNFINKVRDLISVKRIFGNKFIYDGMDYISVVTNEMRQLTQILHMFGIEFQVSQRNTTSYRLNQSQDNEVNEVDIRAIRAGSYQLNMSQNLKDQQVKFEELQASVISRVGYGSMFEDLGSKDTTVKIDNTSMIHNDSILGEYNLIQAQQQRSQISYFHEDIPSGYRSNKFNTEKSTVQ